MIGLDVLGTLILVAAVSAKDVNPLQSSLPCPVEYNYSDDLKFINPTPALLEMYPPVDIMCTEGRYQLMRCCGTGFKSIRWYINNQLITPADNRFFVSDMDQVLRWFKPSPVGLSGISCELVKNDSVSLRHDMMIHVIADCSASKPYYKVQPENECASPGDTVTFNCDVHFGENKCIDPFFKDVYFQDEDGNWVGQHFEGYENTDLKIVKEGSNTTTAYANLTFYDITEKQLNTTYYCFPRRHDYMKVSFSFLGPCEDDTQFINATKVFNKELATKISIPVLIVVFILILILALIYVYRRELLLVWNNHITPSSKGSNEYDAYIICSKSAEDQEFLVNKLVKELGKYYRLCVPDRDFLIGSVIPVQMTEYVKNSKRVIAITSTSLLQTDYCDLSLNVAIANNIPLIFVKPPEVNSDKKEKFNELMSERPELTAALSVSKVVRYPQKADANSLSTFYNTLYSAMPLANRVRQVDVQERQLTDEENEKLS